MQTVLIVEDDYFVATMLSEIMEDNGYAIGAVINNVDDATSFIAENAVDFALLDYNIVGGTTLGIAKSLIDKSVPVIILTGNTTDKALREELPESTILDKPFREAVLMQTIQSVMGV